MAKARKLPKQIAGVKIPKRLRRRGAPVYELINQPMVRNILADVIAAGLLAAADRLSRTPPARKAGKKARHAAAGASEATAEAAAAGAAGARDALAFVAREAARAIKASPRR